MQAIVNSLVALSLRGKLTMPPYMSSRVSLIWASNYLTPHTNAHKTINSMPHIRNPKWGELRPIQPITASGLSPHPFFRLSIPQLVNVDPHKNHSTLNPLHYVLSVHHSPFFLSYDSSFCPTVSFELEGPITPASSDTIRRHLQL